MLTPNEITEISQMLVEMTDEEIEHGLMQLEMLVAMKHNKIVFSEHEVLQ